LLKKVLADTNNSLSARSFQVHQNIASLNFFMRTYNSTDGRSYGRSMGGLTGGVRWGLENVKSL